MRTKLDILYDLVKGYIYSTIPSYIMKVFKETPWIIRSTQIHKFIFRGFFKDDFELYNHKATVESFPRSKVDIDVKWNVAIIDKDRLDPELAKKITVLLEELPDSTILRGCLHKSYIDSNITEFLETTSLPYKGTLDRMFLKKELSKDEKAKSILEDLRNKVDSVL